jgi:hypothetical protein
MFDAPQIAVIQSIENAFAETLCPGDGRLLHAKCMDDMDIKDFYGQRDWRNIPAELIERNNASLCFFSPEAYPFYLPAFLLWVLRHFETSSSFTVESTIYSLAPPESDLRDFVLSKYELLNKS